VLGLVNLRGSRLLSYEPNLDLALGPYIYVFFFSNTHESCVITLKEEESYNMPNTPKKHITVALVKGY